METHSSTFLRGNTRLSILWTVIEEGTEEGYDGHPCGCSPDKHGIVIHRYPEGRLKEIATYWCGKKVGPWISYSPEGEKTSHNLRQWTRKQPF